MLSTRFTPIRLMAAVPLGIACLLAHAGQDSIPATTDAPAHFRVTATVANPGVPAFTATVGGFGNTLISNNGGFEPILIHNAVRATADADDQVQSDPEQLTSFDTFRPHLLEGAKVDVWRITRGEFVHVRTDRVASGGAHLAHWMPLTPGGQVIPATATRLTFRWTDWNRPNAHYYFMLRAVDQAGHESPDSASVDAVSPADLAQVKHGEAIPSQPFQPSRLSFNFGGAVASPLEVHGHMTPDGLLELAWAPTTDKSVAGFRLYWSYDPPASHKGTFLQLEGHAASEAQKIHQGDWVMWSRKAYTLSRAQDFSPRLWKTGEGAQQYLPAGLQAGSDDTPGIQWELVRHEAATPVAEPGETCLKITLAAGVSTQILNYNHGGPDTHWYEVLQPRTYGFSAWLRQEGRGSAVFRVLGPYEGPPARIPPRTLAVESGWKQFASQFTLPYALKGNEIGAMALVLTGPGTFYVDNFRVGRADAGAFDLLPEDAEALKASAMSLWRTHAFIKTGRGGYDLDELTNPAGLVSGTLKSNTLPQTLRAMHATGIDPWLQLEMYLQPADWRNLIEYLAAPYDPTHDTPERKPWAHKRYAQGHPAPWTDDFRQIYFEVSNETWNSLFAPWVFAPASDSATGQKYSPGEAYGLYQEAVVAALRSSPYWSAAHLDTKFHFVIGGFTIDHNYGLDAARRSPSSSLVSMAAYNGGWDSNAPPKPDVPASYFEILNDVTQTAVPFADDLVKAAAALPAPRSPALQFGTYEAGPGYNLNGLNGISVTPAQAAAQEHVMKSGASGTATLDAFLARAYRGFTIQNYFAFGRGDLWTSHSSWYQGGQAWPAWQWLSLFNREATGAMLKTDTLSVPTARLPDSYKRRDGPPAELAAVYALRRGERYAVFVISRRAPDYPVKGAPGDTDVTVDLPFSRCKSVTVWRATGSALEDNYTQAHVHLESRKLDPALLHAGQLHVDAQTGGTARGLPAGQTLLYVFDGVEGP